MKKLLVLILLLSYGALSYAKEIDIHKSKGTDQTEIVSLSPLPAQTNVSQNTIIEAVFNVSLDFKHLKMNDIKLKYITQKKESVIDGNVEYNSMEKAVTFKPNQELEEGCYEVEFKSLKFIDKNQDEQIKEIKYRFKVVNGLNDTIAPVITLNGEASITLFQGQKYIELGAVAVDERDGNVNVVTNGVVDTSLLGNYVVTYTAMDKAGNSSSLERIVTVVEPKLIDLTLESNITLLNIGEKATFTVIGSYEDNSTKPLTSNIKWVVTPTKNTLMNGNILTATKDGQVSVQAEVAGILSNSVNIIIATIVNGYALPPEPDPDLNNATLLGIDSNDNGIRDDVERFIVIKYKDHHKIVTEIGFQGARAYQKILENPLNTAENHKALHDAMDCNHYFKLTAKYMNNGDSILVDHYVDDQYKSLQLNTKARVKAYLEYDKQLSGGVYKATPLGADEKNNCSFDADGLLGGE